MDRGVRVGRGAVPRSDGAGGRSQGLSHRHVCADGGLLRRVCVPGVFEFGVREGVGWVPGDEDWVS